MEQGLLMGLQQSTVTDANTDVNFGYLKYSFHHVVSLLYVSGCHCSSVSVLYAPSPVVSDTSGAVDIFSLFFLFSLLMQLVLNNQL